MRSENGRSQTRDIPSDAAGESRAHSESVSIANPPTDLRSQRKQMENRLALAVVVFLVVVGSVGITLAYGNRALVLGSLCLIMGSLLFGLVWGILTLIERWA